MDMKLQEANISIMDLDSGAWTTVMMKEATMRRHLRKAELLPMPSGKVMMSQQHKLSMHDHAH